MKVLIVDDEKQLVEALTAILKQNKIEADAAYNGEDGLDSALTGIYDAIILDIMLPKINGLDVLNTLRKEGISTPILLLSAKSEVPDKIAGLNIGADDYLTKPFDTRELIARLKALTRRGTTITGDILEFGNVSLNSNTHNIECLGHSMQLGSKEYEIMEMLIKNKGNIIPKEKFNERIWGYDSEAEYNTIEVYISFLRKKLNALSADVQIKSLRNVGYRLEESHD